MIKPIFRTSFILLFFLLSSFNLAGSEYKTSNCHTDKDEISISCEWPALVLLELSQTDNLHHGDYVTIEAFGYSVNGGIPPTLDVDDDYDFYWPGQMEQISERTVRVKLSNLLSENKITVVYTLTVDGKSCRDTSTYTFTLIDDPFDNPTCYYYPPSVYIEQDKEGPFCHGEVVKVEAFGYSEAGPIPSALHKCYYYFNGTNEIEILDDKTINITIDDQLDNKLQIVFELEFDLTPCYDTIYAEFELKTGISSELVDVKWSPGDELTVFTEEEGFCYQWGKIIDDEEVLLDGENEKSINVSEGVKSIFVNKIEGEEAIPYETFEEIYFVEIQECGGERPNRSSARGQCVGRDDEANVVRS